MSDGINIQNKINSIISDPDGNNNKKFILSIVYKNKKTFRFIKNTNEKYCKIIDELDNINFDELYLFELEIIDNIYKNKIVNINHLFKNINEEDFYTYKDEIINVEFVKVNKNTTCGCYIKNINNLNNNINRFYTPPNY